MEDKNGKDLVVTYPCKNYSIRCMSQEHDDLNVLTERHGKPHVYPLSLSLIH